MNSLTIPFINEATIRIEPRTLEVGGGFNSTGISYGIIMSRIFDILAPLTSPVLVDVGASNGAFTLLGVLKPMRIISFEPNPDVFAILTTNCRLNDVKAELHNAALSDKTGMGWLKLNPEPTQTGLATLGDNVSRFKPAISVPVELKMLDSLNLQQVDFIKIDTEGSEVAVLRGAIETIKRCKPTMLIEYCDENLRQCGSHIGELNTLLQSLGYKWEKTPGEDILAFPY